MGVLSEKRAGRITASAIGSILGSNPYQSKDDYMRTLIRDYHGAEKEFKGNAATQYGHDNEDLAISHYESASFNEVIRDPDFVTHPVYDWLGATPDGLIGEYGLVEIKCPFFAKQPYCLKEKEMYLHQCYIQLVCTGRQWLDFYVWTPDAQNLERVYLTDAVIWFDKNIGAIESFYNEYLEIRENGKLSAPYLEDKEMDLSNDAEFITASDLVLLTKGKFDLAAKQFKDAKSGLISIAMRYDKKCVGNGVQVIKSTRQGAVDYKKVPGISDVDLDDYRKADTVVWSVR